MKKIVKISSYILVIILLIIAFVIGYRFFKYKNLIGKYQLVTTLEKDDYLELKLFSWNRGNIKDQECNLWGCSGYEKGVIYYIKEDKIYFKFDKYNVYVVNFKIKNDKEKKYLILEEESKKEKFVKIKK